MSAMQVNVMNQNKQLLTTDVPTTITNVVKSLAPKFDLLSSYYCLLCSSKRPKNLLLLLDCIL